MKVGGLRKSAQRLGFTPSEQVRWLSPSQLVGTAGKVAVSSLFAGFADRREVQAALPADEIKVAGPHARELWIDYVADLGDGFDATYTIAWLLSRPELVVDGRRLPRGDVLVMGGDEVYPTPSATAYEDRTTGPYRSALPAADPAPTLLAIPGNHDWYDGLNAFLRIFTQRRPIGGWRTAQTRSYFVTRLPRHWWLVGLDTQLGSYIDDPQVRYFREHLTAHLEPGDSVIVCAPTPTWVHTGLAPADRDVDAFNSLHWFERELVEFRTPEQGGPAEPTGAEVRLWLSGDFHHYARYAEDPVGDAATADPASDVGSGEAPGEGRARQMVTCGLGGAYLSSTDFLPDTLELPPRESRMGRRDEPESFSLRSAWPDRRTARRRSFGILRPPPHGVVARNPGLWRLLGLVHAAAVPVLLFLLGLGQGRTPVQALMDDGWRDVGLLSLQLGAWLVAGLVLAAAVPLLHRRRPRPPGSSWYALVVVVQLVLALVSLGVVVTVVPWPGTGDWKLVAVAAALTFAVTGYLACYLFAACVVIAPTRAVRDWAYSGQAVEDVKGFLRLHLDADGRVTVHPLRVERVCHDWDTEPVGVDAGRPAAAVQRLRPVPAPGAMPEPTLIEAPFVITRTRHAERA